MFISSSEGGPAVGEAISSKSSDRVVRRRFCGVSAVTWRARVPSSTTSRDGVHLMSRPRRRPSPAQGKAVCGKVRDS